MLKYTVPVILLLVSFVFAQNKDFHELTLKGLDHAYNLELEEATQIFDELIAMQPDNPHGYILQALNHFYRLQWDDRDGLEKRFEQLSSKAMKTAKRRLSNSETRVDALFYLGTIHVYMAAYHGTKSNWIRAYWFGKEGIDYLKKAVELEPDYYDAYLGLGMYHYYADVMPKFIKAVSSLLGIEGDRQRGMRELEMAAENGIYTRAESLFLLGNLYLYSENDEEKALEYAETLASLYPRNPGFLDFLAETLRANGRHPEAVQTFETALQRAQNHDDFFQILIRYNLGDTYFELNEFEAALEQYRRCRSLAETSPAKVEWARALTDYKTGLCYDMLDRHELAVEFYKQVKKSDHKRAYEVAQEKMEEPFQLVDRDRIRGMNLIKTKEFDAAATIFQETVSNVIAQIEGYPAKQMARLKYELGRALFEKEDYSLAQKELLAVLEAEEVSKDWIKPWAHFYLGECYRKTGDFQEAKQEYEEAHEFDDSNLRFEIEKAREKLAHEIYLEEKI